MCFPPHSPTAEQSNGDGAVLLAGVCIIQPKRLFRANNWPEERLVGLLRKFVCHFPSSQARLLLLLGGAWVYFWMIYTEKLTETNRTK